MAEKRAKTLKPAVIFGRDTVKKVGYIDEYIFACEIKGGDHIRYSKPRRPKYHLVIIVIDGSIDLIIPESIGKCVIRRTPVEKLEAFVAAGL